MRRPAVPVVLVVALLVATACAGQPEPAGTAGRAPSATPTTAPASTALAPTAPAFPPFQKATVAPFDLAHLRTLPPDAAVGTAYPFDLYAHCGIDLTRFGGASWRAEQPYVDGLPGYVVGTMELLDADTARFVFDQRYFASTIEVIIFHKTADEVPLCE